MGGGGGERRGGEGRGRRGRGLVVIGGSEGPAVDVREEGVGGGWGGRGTGRELLGGRNA